MSSINLIIPPVFHNEIFSPVNLPAIYSAEPDWSFPGSRERVPARLPAARYYRQARTVKYQMAAQIPEARIAAYQAHARVLCWV